MIAKPPVPKSTPAKPPPPAPRAPREDDDASELLASAETPGGREGADGRIPGVPRQVSSAAKRVVAAVVAVAAILVVAGGLRAMQVRQQREADDARTRPVDTAATAPSVPVWPSVTPTESAANPSTAPGLSTGPAVDPGLNSTTTPNPGGESSLPGLPGEMEVHGPAEGPSLPAGPVHETSLGGRDLPGASIVSQANHALVRGETARALSLARQAVAANPADADAWLTLGAACQSSGDSAGARDAYSNCLTRAHTANISECRLLARARP